MSQEKVPCSVLILTRNSAGTIERCLRNLEPFAEILVHDANSEDDTVAIATRMGARVLKQYDTEEKSVRVKDFTQMRLKQRADAVYDWVLYLDADEYLSVGLVDEIAGILKGADEKIIVKVPRLPIIDGRLRTQGVFFPEVVPRIHNRAGGCTLLPGKIVHEKYVYDDSFVEVVTTHHLCVPTASVDELRSKDDRYLLLEIERIRREGYRWGQYFRWILLREPLVILSILLKIVRNIPKYRDPDAVPFAHEWRYVRYHWRLLRAFTGAMIAKKH